MNSSRKTLASGISIFSIDAFVLSRAFPNSLLPAFFSSMHLISAEILSAALTIFQRYSSSSALKKALSSAIPDSGLCPMGWSNSPPRPS
jgi:hypothetical protein